jgi:hypothetical protein
MKKIILSILFLLSNTACQMVGVSSLMNSLGVGGINSTTDMTAEEFLKGAQKVNKRYQELFKDLPTKTTAKIKRGSTFIAIDFTKPSDILKIKKNDIILLEEGMYQNLPEISAHGVVIEGVNKNKTVVGDLTKNQMTSIQGERLFFSKVTLYNSYFHDTLYKTKGHSDYIFSEVRLVGGSYEHKLYGNGSTPYASMTFFFSEVYDHSTNEKFSLPSSGYYTYFETYCPKCKTTYFEKDEYGRARDYAQSLRSNTPKKFEQDEVYKIALKNFKENNFVPLHPETVRAFQEELIGKVSQSIASSSHMPDPTSQKDNRFKLILDFYERDYSYKISDTRNTNISNYSALLKEADKSGRYLTAALAASLKYEETSLTTGSEGAIDLFSKYLKQAANKYSCTRNVVVAKDALEDETFFKQLSEKYPILGLNAQKSSCRLSYIQNINKKDIYKTNRAVSTSPVMAETMESKRRNAAIERATQEATEAKWKAQAALSADRLSQAGSIFKKSMATYGKVGNVEYMVYGKGSFSPKDDPLLKYSSKVAEAKLKSANEMQNNTQKMEQVDAITTNSYYAVNNLNYEASLSAQFSNGKKALVKGPLVSYKASKYCENRTFSSGAKVVSHVDGDVRNCGDFNEISFRRYVEAYDRDSIMYYFQEAFYENEMAKIVNIASQYIHSTDPKDQLEGYLISIGLNLKVDPSKLKDLTKNIFGKELSSTQIKMRIIKK